MLETLRRDGAANLDRSMSEQGVAGLDEGFASALRATLKELIDADTARLQDLDRFGENVYRATFLLTSGRQSRQVFILLVEKDGALRWAGRN